MTATWVTKLSCFLLGTASGVTRYDAPPAAASPQSAPHISANFTQEVQHGVLVVRHGVAERPRIETKPAARAATREEIALAQLAGLADLGLIHIRPIATESGPSWKYKPATYHGYHAKPDWSYQSDAGWQYRGANGWRLYPQPAWTLRPGAVNALLTQLPTSGDNWRVTRWE